jgi:two-component system response regulator TctD
MRFLLIEDNISLAAVVENRLSLDGHVIDHAKDIATADEYTATTEYDLILLDIMLPDGDGRDFLASRGSKNLKTPIIVLTARSEISDKVSILDLGADDYMTKPIDFSELEARCRAVLRRKGGSAQTNFSHGNVSFDPVSALLKVGTENVTLRTRELRLLELLISSPGQIFSKSKLVDRLFSYDQSVTENAIEVYIGRLRRHLVGADLSITTIRGLGYKLEKSELL